jgi:hypothetical protein
LPPLCRHIRVLVATSDHCSEKRVTSAEQGDLITITVQQGLSSGGQQESKHHLLRLKKSIQVRP